MASSSRSALIRWLGIAGLLFAAQVRADAPNDTIFLRSGGRARGVVIESDPSTGTRVQLPDGSVRSYEPRAIDRIEYGSSSASSSPQPTAADGSWGAAEPDAQQGTLRVESTETGDVFIEGGDYGPTPAVIPRMSAGLHEVEVRFHAGEAERRTVNVRGGGETSARFEPSAAIHAFRARKEWHIGAGIDGGFAHDSGGEQLPAISGFVRSNYAVTRILELRGDLRLGLFPVSHLRSAYSGGRAYAEERKHSLFGVALRADAQLNLGSIFTISGGVDIGIAAEAGLFKGVHFSPAGVRMGALRKYLLAFEVGVMSGVEAFPVLNLALSYLL